MKSIQRISESSENKTVAYKEQIINLLDMIEGDLKFLRQIYTIMKTHVMKSGKNW